MHCRKTKHPDLHKWFCVETIKVCCPKGTFGPDCNGNRICSVLVEKKKYCHETYDKVAGDWFFWFSSPKPVWGALTDLVTEMECATAMVRAEETGSAAVTMVTRGSSVWTASTATSTKWGTTPSHCAQVRSNTKTTHFHSQSEIRGEQWACCKFDFGLYFLLQNATLPAKLALGEPIRTATSAKKAGKRTNRKPVLVRGTVNAGGPNNWNQNLFSRNKINFGTAFWYSGI